MIEASHIQYAIGRKTLLDDVSLTARPGELVAIVGANGAGKSTLLKVLSKEISPQAGTVSFNGTPLKHYSREQLAQFRAVLAQQNALAFNFNVLDLVMMGRYPHFNGRPSDQDREIVQYCIQKTGVSHLTDRIFMTLSGGEQQRVHLAKVISQLLDYEDLSESTTCTKRPKYLLLDEPITGLDLYYQHNLLDIAKTLTERGFCVVAILHDLNLALQYAHRVLLMKEGRVLGFGKPTDVLTSENVLHAFNISVNLIHQAGMECPFIVHCKEPVNLKPRHPSWQSHFIS